MRVGGLKRALSCSIRMLGNGHVIGIAATPRSPRSRPDSTCQGRLLKSPNESRTLPRLGRLRGGRTAHRRQKGPFQVGLGACAHPWFDLASDYTRAIWVFVGFPRECDSAHGGGKFSQAPIGQRLGVVAVQIQGRRKSWGWHGSNCWRGACLGLHWLPHAFTLARFRRAACPMQKASRALAPPNGYNRHWQRPLSNPVSLEFNVLSQACSARRRHLQRFMTRQRCKQQPQPQASMLTRPISGTVDNCFVGMLRTPPAITPS
jgi:hypothetical protein